YSISVDTANGRTRAAPVTLDRLSIGDITERSVPALVAQGGQLRTSLLGMTFLNRLESWEVRGDKLMMRRYPGGSFDQAHRKADAGDEQETAERNLEPALRQRVGEPRAIGRGEARDRGHQGEANQRHEAERERRQVRLLRQTGEDVADRACNGDRHAEPRGGR